MNECLMPNSTASESPKDELFFLVLPSEEQTQKVGHGLLLWLAIR